MYRQRYQLAKSDALSQRSYMQDDAASVKSGAN